MTNWITAAGLALIAGGLATLIGFRHALLGRTEPAPRGERRRGGSPVTVPSQIRARRRRQALAALPPAPARAAIEAPQAADDPVAPPSDGPSAPADLPSFRADEPKHAVGLPSFPADEPQHAAEAAATRSGKGRRSGRTRTFMSRSAANPSDASLEEGASPGGEPWTDEPVRTRGRRQSRAKDLEGPTQSVKTRFAPRGVVDEPTSAVAAVPATHPERKRPAREGDRIQGWVRPEYEDEEPAAGDYWTPVPEQSYGWPTPVQRLPAAPPYPSSRFDPIDQPRPSRESGPAAAPESGPESSAQVRADLRPEPTGAVPPWPPAQPADHVEPLPTRSARDVQQRPVRRSAEPVGAEPENPPRSRPRPRPRPSAGTPPERSTVYRSRHAADPS